MGKRGDAAVEIVHALQDAGALEVKDGLTDFLSVRSREHKLSLAGTGDHHLGILVDIAVGVTRDGDGLFPSADRGGNAFDQDRGAENGAVEDGADRAVGALPHLLEAVFFHALGVGRNGGALDGHAVLQGSVGAVDGHLIIGFIAVFQPEVVIFRFEVDVGLNEQLLDIRPENPGHFIPVHFNEGCFHLNLCHGSSPHLQHFCERKIL